MTFLYYTLFTLLLTVAVLLILLILIQKGRGGGLSSAFGGGGGSQAFGAKTGDVLTWATSIVFGVFILLAVALDLVVGSQYKGPPQTVATQQPAGPVTVNGNGQTPALTPDQQAFLDALKKQNPATQPATAPAVVVPSLNQVINNAATQATGQTTGAVKAATQPVEKLLSK
jgi:preprotein translocase subunit SecG